MNRTSLLHVAKIGRAVGVSGELKLHISSDFKEQFCSGAVFFLDSGKEITIERFNERSSIIKFKEFNSREDAKTLTNKNLFTTIQKSREFCNLESGQYFWFDIIGSKLYDNDRYIGDIIDIERIADIDYLIVKSDNSFTKSGLAKRFMVPYIDRYILKFDLENKTLLTVDTLDLLEAS